MSLCVSDDVVVVVAITSQCSSFNLIATTKLFVHDPPYQHRFKNIYINMYQPAYGAAPLNTDAQNDTYLTHGNPLLGL